MNIFRVDDYFNMSAVLHATMAMLTVVVGMLFKFSWVYVSAESSCYQIPVPEVLSEMSGKYLVSASYENVTANNHVVCSVRCLRQRKCKSVNYDTTEKLCNLNVDSHLTAPSKVAPSHASFKYYYADDMHQKLLGGCQSHTCPDEDICQSVPSNPGEPRYSCTSGSCEITSSCADCTQKQVVGSGTFEAVGCYASGSSPVLSKLLVNTRSSINWSDINFFKQFVRVCAWSAAYYSYFGIEYYGECYAGNTSDVVFPSSEIAIDKCDTKCLYDGVGVGSSNVIFVYKWST